MQIPEKNRPCVVFVASQKKQTKKLEGTAFFVIVEGKRDDVFSNIHGDGKTRN